MGIAEWRLSPLVLGIFLGVGMTASGFYIWPILANSSDTNQFDAELSEEVMAGIDLLAAHPEDIERPDSVQGVSDNDLLALDHESIDLLLDPMTIQIAYDAPTPRQLFEIGRVAWIHEEFELAYELLSVAAEGGSAPAYYYLADYYPDDPEYALELLGAAIEGGFAPASDLWDVVAESIAASQETSVLEIDAIQAGDFSVFEQPQIVKGLHTGETDLSRFQFDMPARAPDFYTWAKSMPELSQQLDRVFIKLYICHLAVMLGEKGLEEDPNYVTEGVPHLKDLVSAKVTSAARVDSQTQEVAVTQYVSKYANQIAKYKPVIDVFRAISDQDSKPDAFSDAIKMAGKGVLDNQERSVRLELFNQAIREAANRDAGIIKRIYQFGDIDDARDIYTTLSRIVLQTQP